GKRLMRVMTYVMNDGHAISPPSQGYLHTIMDGYEDFGLDSAALDAAAEKSLRTSVPLTWPE
ncbi:MAG: hypothetical protein LBS19_07770, partial [Clostridiales bacterium]|nr:hypothetical protein [Clostridiales bacterium]